MPMRFTPVCKMVLLTVTVVCANAEREVSKRKADTPNSVQTRTHAARAESKNKEIDLTCMAASANGEGPRSAARGIELYMKSPLVQKNEACHGGMSGRKKSSNFLNLALGRVGCEIGWGWREGCC